MAADITQDPEDVLDYTIDYSNILPASDSIASSSWAVDPGVTVDQTSFSGLKSFFWVSGGTADQIYTATNHVVSTEGREVDFSVTIRIREA
jgi:hypothetical protein